MNLADHSIAQLRQRLNMQPPDVVWRRRSEFLRSVQLYRAGLDPAKKNQEWHEFNDKEQRDLLAVGEAWL